MISNLSVHTTILFIDQNIFLSGANSNLGVMVEVQFPISIKNHILSIKHDSRFSSGTVIIVSDINTLALSPAHGACPLTSNHLVPTDPGRRVVVGGIDPSRVIEQASFRNAAIVLSFTQQRRP